MKPLILARSNSGALLYDFRSDVSNPPGGSYLPSLVKQDFENAFQQVDVIASPVSPTTAFRIGEKVDDPIQMYLTDVFTISANLAGICGVSVRCGFDNEGLPIGLQLLGPSLGEEVILRTAHAYEQTTEWSQRRPALAM